MANCSFEIVEGALVVSGSLDRAGDAELQKELERYCKDPACPEKTIEMSGVRWLTPSGAKVLIQAGQDIQEKGKKLRIVASRHVNQTLSLLGAKTWLQIETAAVPVKNGEGDSGAAAPTDSQKKIALNASSAPVAPAAPAVVAAPENSPAAPVTSTSAAPAAAAPIPSASGSGLQAAVWRGGGALASPVEDLNGGAYLLRVLIPNRRYAFHLSGGTDIIGIVRERIGGSWIVVETTSTRKIVNLDVVAYCEVL